jgi:hypothetical protein
VPLGQDLIDLLREAKRQVLLVAPFMKLEAATRAMAAIPADISDICLVTRWKPEEVAAGVSDLEVLDLVESRPGARLMLHPCLHAKLYRADERCLLGSANLTSKALGWAAPPNIELLVEYATSSEAVQALEKRLLADAIPATAEIRAAVAAAAASFTRPLASSPEPVETWLPSCPAPERLYNVYADFETFRLADSSAEAGRADLRVLDIPLGLAEGAFHQFVVAAFSQMPLVQRIKARLVGATTDDTGSKILADELDALQLPYGDAEIAWEIFKRWLMVFGGGEFRVRPVGEELVRGKKL